MKRLICFTLILISIQVSGQQKTRQEQLAEDIGIIPRPGFEPMPRSKGYRPDTANIRPQNFSFNKVDGITLEQRIQMTSGKKAPATCKPAWGVFAFRINGNGKIDSIRYQGNLHPNVSERVLAGIRSTEKYWIVRSGTKPSQYAWYVYPFFDKLGRWDKSLRCSPEEKALQENIASLSSLVFQLFFQIDTYYNSATMIMRGDWDGLPQM